MLRDSILHFSKFMSFDPALVKESIMYVQVMSNKTSNLAAVDKACLVRDAVC